MIQQKIRQRSRQHDEMILKWLQWRERGCSYADIARHEGLGRGTVSRACGAVFDEMEGS